MKYGTIGTTIQNNKMIEVKAIIESEVPKIIASASRDNTWQYIIKFMSKLYVEDRIESDFTIKNFPNEKRLQIYFSKGNDRCELTFLFSDPTMTSYHKSITPAPTLTKINFDIKSCVPGIEVFDLSTAEGIDSLVSAYDRARQLLKEINTA